MMRPPLCRTVLAWMLAAAALGAAAATSAQADDSAAPSPQRRQSLDWRRLPDLPDELGVAGPFVGVHNDALIVAGGANFAPPVWESEKVWRDRIYVLWKAEGDAEPAWIEAGNLPRPIGYGAAVSTPDGVVCIGGNNAGTTFREVFLLQWDPSRSELSRVDYPPLPEPCAYAQAALIGQTIYLCSGQSGSQLNTATNRLWGLDLSLRGNRERFDWRELAACPGPERAFHIVARQHNGYDECLYVLSGRRQRGDDVEFLQDLWEYNPRLKSWRERASCPRCVMAGAGIDWGQSHLLVLGGDAGDLFFRADELRDEHPGFVKEALGYHTLTDAWTSFGEMPANHVTTIPVKWNDRIVIASGEVRPRVRSPAVWSVAPAEEGD